MQDNVIDILTAAQATGNFAVIRDRYLRDEDRYPALVVASRKKIPESQNTRFTSYNGPWEYEVLIFRVEDDALAEDPAQGGADWVDLENLVKTFLSQLLGDGSWELTEGPEFGNLTVISGTELIGARLFVSKHNVDRY